jgi:hypothetical protein
LQSSHALDGRLCLARDAASNNHHEPCDRRANMDETQYGWSNDDCASHDGSSPCDDTDDDEHATTPPPSRLRPAGSALAFVPYANWKPDKSYDGEPTIHYNLEWKLSVKNRAQAGESELHVVIPPRKFWIHVLQPKITKACVNKPWKEEKTKLVLSVTDRKTAKITKEFPKLDIDWSYVTSQLREWSKFLNDGKVIMITVIFHYE